MLFPITPTPTKISRLEVFFTKLRTTIEEKAARLEEAKEISDSLDIEGKEGLNAAIEHLSNEIAFLRGTVEKMEKVTTLNEDTPEVSAILEHEEEL